MLAVMSSALECRKYNGLKQEETGLISTHQIKKLDCLDGCHFTVQSLLHLDAVTEKKCEKERAPLFKLVPPL